MSMDTLNCMTLVAGWLGSTQQLADRQMGGSEAGVGRGLGGDLTNYW